MPVPITRGESLLITYIARRPESLDSRRHAISPFGARQTVTLGPLFLLIIFDAITSTTHIILLLCPALHPLRSPQL